MGKMNVPPSDETVDSIAPPTHSQGAQSKPPVWTPGAPTGAPNPSPSLRITAQPMGPVASQAQALFADQTDGQLTQGSASAIHTLSNAPLNSAVGPLPSLRTPPPDSSRLNITQYTPSAQEAATGAYSAPRQQQPQPPAQQPDSTVPLSAPPPPKPSATKRVYKPKRTPKLKQSSEPTLDQAPVQARLSQPSNSLLTRSQPRTPNKPKPPMICPLPPPHPPRTLA